MNQKKQGCLSFDPRLSLFKNDSSLWIPPINFKFHCKNQLLIKKQDKQKEKSIYIGQKYIKYSNHKCISFSDAFLTILRNQNSQINGVRLEKRGEWIELYGEITELIPLFMKECISLDFVSNFQIVQLIGSGSTANVYQVKSKINNLDYAIKVFDKTMFEKDLPLKESIMMEIKFMKQFHHQNIIRFKGVFESNTQIIVLSELADGGDLQQNIEGKKLLEDQVRDILRSVLQGLNYMHNQGIFHRDIKKSNIMLKIRGDFTSICLVDLGLADTANDENNYLFKYCGTPGYVAPEILRKQKYGVKVDIYSVGILCYQLLVGKDPYFSSSTKETIIKNFLGQISYADFPFISPKAMDLMKKLLDLDPNTRPSAQEALNHPFLYNDKRCNFQINKTSNSPPRLNSSLQRPLFILNNNASPSSSPRKIYIKGHLTPRIQNRSPINSNKSLNTENQRSSLYFKRPFLKMNTK